MTPARGAAALLATALVGALVLVAAAPAQAASRYRFWSYWYAGPGASSWTYAPVGPAGHGVDDGSVEGWHFVVAVPNSSAPPPGTSAASAFDRICGGTTRPDGKDRVALVVDFGDPSDAPRGEHPPSSTVRGTCVVVPDRSSGLTVLASAGYSVRQNNSGLVCSVQGYPRTECGVTVKDSPTPTSKPTHVPSPSRSTPKAPPTTTPEVVKPGEPGGSSGPAPPTGSPTGPTPSPTDSSAPASAPGSTPGASSTGDALEVGPPPDDTGSSRGGPLGLLLGALAVAAVSGAAYRRNRRRGTT